MEAKKITLLALVLLLALGVAFALYLSIIQIIIDPYLQKTQGSLFALASFYETQNPHDAIYFLGSSQMRDAINAHSIERQLGNTTSAYNLGFTGDLALRRLAEIDSILGTKPKIIVIGITFHSISDRSHVPEDHLALVSQKMKTNEKTELFFDQRQHELIDYNWLDRIIFKRKFIFAAIIDIVGLNRQNEFEDSTNVVGNFKDPFFYNKNQSEEVLKKKLGPKTEMYNTFVVSREDNSNKRALIEFIRILKGEKIKVVILDMPIHPLLQKELPEEINQNYQAYINESLLPIVDGYFDFQREYDQSHFLDLTHLNAKGKDDFSAKVAQILQEMI